VLCVWAGVEQLTENCGSSANNVGGLQIECRTTCAVADANKVCYMACVLFCQFVNFLPSQHGS
jgi:hypothetical protein